MPKTTTTNHPKSTTVKTPATTPELAMHKNGSSGDRKSKQIPPRNTTSVITTTKALKASTTNQPTNTTFKTPGSSTTKSPHLQRKNPLGIGKILHQQLIRINKRTSRRFQRNGTSSQRCLKFNQLSNQY